MSSVRMTMRHLEKRTKEVLKSYRLPMYEEIPNVGLYLKQVVKYINDFLEPLGLPGLTDSMVSNYVKQKLIDAPNRRQYSRDQIAYLIFIAFSKNVLSMGEIRFLKECQNVTHSIEDAYKRFFNELMTALGNLSGLGEENDDRDYLPEQILLRCSVITIANKIYLGKFFEVSRELMRAQEKEGSEQVTEVEL
ncbi:MAG: DUF1836 domain-containing protein [Eubacterium sp.]|nr:DUF1836 domain-containing protein [Eubacterium sp.]